MSQTSSGPALSAALRFPLAVGLSASITIGLPVLLVSGVGVREELAVAVAMVVAFFVNFFVNKRFVFKSTHQGGGQLLRFFLTNASMRVVDYLGFLLLFNGLGLNYVVSLVIVLSITTVARFFMFSRIFASQ